MNFGKTHSKSRAEIKISIYYRTLGELYYVIRITGIPLAQRSYAAVQRRRGCYLCAAQ
jgi:hypothetical protein